MASIGELNVNVNVDVNWPLMDWLTEAVCPDGVFWCQVDKRGWPLEAITAADRFTYMLDAQES